MEAGPRMRVTRHRANVIIAGPADSDSPRGESGCCGCATNCPDCHKPLPLPAFDPARRIDGSFVGASCRPARARAVEAGMAARAGGAGRGEIARLVEDICKESREPPRTVIRDIRQFPSEGEFTLVAFGEMSGGKMYERRTGGELGSVRPRAHFPLIVVCDPDKEWRQRVSASLTALLLPTVSLRGREAAFTIVAAADTARSCDIVAEVCRRGDLPPWTATVRISPGRRGHRVVTVVPTRGGAADPPTTGAPPPESVPSGECDCMEFLTDALEEAIRGRPEEYELNCAQFVRQARAIAGGDSCGCGDDEKVVASSGAGLPSDVRQVMRFHFRVHALATARLIREADSLADTLGMSSEAWSAAHAQAVQATLKDEAECVRALRPVRCRQGAVTREWQSVARLVADCEWLTCGGVP
jgi:hypothetical protein